MFIIGCIVLIILVSFISYARSGETRGGKLGQRIRNSDHWAWVDAVREKEEELKELRAAEPKYKI